MNKKQWAFKSKPFNAQQVNKRLLNFHSDQLYEENSKNNWKIFAKQFSQMNISESDISQMKFQDFLALKKIMSVTLGDLVQQTQQSRQNVSKYEIQNKKLEQELKKLEQIQKANKKVELQVREQLQELKQSQKSRLREQESFYDQQYSQIIHK